MKWGYAPNDYKHPATDKKINSEDNKGKKHKKPHRNLTRWGSFIKISR